MCLFSSKRAASGRICPTAAGAASESLKFFPCLRSGNDVTDTFFTASVTVTMEMEPI
jgi:hypothetical protein